MSFPEKWRNPVSEPSELDLGPDLELREVLGYPHAGNDVFACEGTYKGEETMFFIKCARHRDADPANEAAILRSLPAFGPTTPQVLLQRPAAEKHPAFIVVAAVPGERMPGSLEGDRWADARSDLSPYIEEWSRTLSVIHGLPLPWRPVAHREVFDLPTIEAENPSADWLRGSVDWLTRVRPKAKAECFVHGDFHYANLFWNGDRISGVIDWELAGRGSREFDLAWACFPRPSQNFLREWSEQRRFVQSYSVAGALQVSHFAWCFVHIACRFLSTRSSWSDAAYHKVIGQLSDLWRERRDVSVDAL